MSSPVTEKRPLPLRRLWSRLVGFFRRHPQVYNTLCVVVAVVVFGWGIATMEGCSNYLDTLSDEELVQLALQAADTDTLRMNKSIIENIALWMVRPEVDEVTTIWGHDGMLYVCGRRFVAELDGNVGMVSARQPDGTWENTPFSSYLAISTISDSPRGILLGGLDRNEVGTLSWLESEGKRALALPPLADVSALLSRERSVWVGSSNGYVAEVLSFNGGPVNTDRIQLETIHTLWGVDERVFAGGEGREGGMIATFEKGAWTSRGIGMETVRTVWGRDGAVYAGGAFVNRQSLQSGAAAHLQDDGTWEVRRIPGMDEVHALWGDGTVIYAGGNREDPKTGASEGVVGILEAGGEWRVDTVPGLTEVRSIWGDGEQVYAGGESPLGGLVASPAPDSGWTISVVPGFEGEGLYQLFETKSEPRSWLLGLVGFIYFMFCVFGYTELTTVRKQPQPAPGETGTFAGVDESDAVKQAQQAEEAFRYNLTQPFRLRGLEVHDLAFYEDFRWAFQPQINVLLGKNGYGKSHLLRAVTALLLNNSEKARQFFRQSSDDAYIKLALDRGGEPLVIHRAPLRFEQTIGQVPVLAIPDARFINRARDTVSRVEDEHSDLQKDGAYHFLHGEPYEAVIQNFITQLCIDIDKARGEAELPRLVTSVVHDLTDPSFDFHEVKNLGQGRYRCLVTTEGNPDNPLPIQKASQGTLSVLAMVGLVYDYLRVVFETDRDVLSRPAIVFIDEIDAHLHPSWQQKIVNLLRKHFPKVQFIITAHSPLVVAGCLNGEVAVLQKNPQTQQFKVRSFEHDFIGWEAEDIYQTVFEVEDKDEHYKHYNSQSPRKKQLEAEIEKLKGELKGTLKDEVKAEKLDALERKQREVRYIERANSKQDERLEQKRLVRENEQLARNNRKLEALLEDMKKQQPQPSTSAQEAELDRLRWQNKELTQMLADLQGDDDASHSETSP